MAKFSSDCLQRMKDVANSLDKNLGPGTSELNMRFGKSCNFMIDIQKFRPMTPLIFCLFVKLLI